MAAYQDKALARIRGGLKRFKTIAAKAKSAGINEADTRIIVTSILSDLLGWCQFEDITSEHMVRGNYVDFVIRWDGGLFAIIEVKAITLALSDKHLYQAVTYAANEGVDWVMLTNGDEWAVYKVLFSKPVDKDLVFHISLLDPDTKPAEQAQLLYLISREAQRKDELAAYYQRKAALCGSKLAAALLGEPILKKLRAEMKAQGGHSATLEELATILVEEVIRPEVQGNETARLIRKAAAVGKGRPTESKSSAVSLHGT